jgi:uncharacterized membrane protein
MNELLGTIMACGLMTAGAAAELPQRWTLQELTHPDAYSFSISDLNDAGAATGSTYSTDPNILYQPYIWQNGEVHLIPTTAYWTKGYHINESGLCMGVDIDVDRALHYSLDGIVDLGHIADMFGTNMYMHGMNESGQFIGYRPLGAGVFQAVTWNETDGIVHITPDQSHSYGQDINDAGVAVGYHGLTNATTAFMYHDGVRTDFGSLWNGATKALAIDDAGRILVRRTLGSVSSFHQVDSADFSMTTIASFGGDVTNIEVVANETGGVAFAWNTNDGTGFTGHLGWWSEQDGFLELQAPGDSIGIMLRAVNASGWIMGMSHDSDYNLQTFVTTVENDMHIVDDRVIGHESIFMLTASDMNASGQIGTLVTFWGGEDMTAVLSPARPGDANGDGQVNITDLLLIIGLWGEWPVGGICGPDLDMNGLINVEDLLRCIGDWGS